MIKNLFRKLFPKWKYIYKPYAYTFEGETLTQYQLRYREHPESGKIYKYSYSPDTDWDILSEPEMNVIRKHLKSGKLLYK